MTFNQRRHKILTRRDNDKRHMNKDCKEWERRGRIIISELEQRRLKFSRYGIRDKGTTLRINSTLHILAFQNYCRAWNNNRNRKRGSFVLSHTRLFYRNTVCKRLRTSSRRMLLHALITLYSRQQMWCKDKLLLRSRSSCPCYSEKKS